MFIAMKQVLKDHGAVSITIDCLGGCYKGKLQAYPCLGFMELQDIGLFGTCENDDRGCRTKMVVEVTGDFEKAYLHWNKLGWHRVTFLGDFKKDAVAFAKKIGYKVVYES